MYNMIVDGNTTNDMLQKFFELEETFDKAQLTSGEEDCERKFQLNTTRDDSGRYCSKTPFKENSELGSSRGHAIG